MNIILFLRKGFLFALLLAIGITLAPTQSPAANEPQVSQEKLYSTENIADTWRETFGYISAAWNYEVASIDGLPITIGKIITGFLLFFIGLFLSRRISSVFASRVLNRFELAEGVIAAFESLVFYVLVIFFALFALRLVNVPLTVFTVIGGAVAIGVGFGSQNIVNNFISGIILLIERPVRVGDLIEVDSLIGTINRIGLRSILIRTGDNIDIIVPNSSFLEKNVVNWTLGDDRVRLYVKVGVVYGSPLDKVKELLLQVVTENQSVLKSPEPHVWFKDFGDDSLVFEIHFWCVVKKMSHKNAIESDIRFEIDKYFRENNIVIAFPQRDVHLDSIKPVEVRIINEK